MSSHQLRKFILGLSVVDALIVAVAFRLCSYWSSWVCVLEWRVTPPCSIVTLRFIVAWLYIDLLCVLYDNKSKLVNKSCQYCQAISFALMIADVFVFMFSVAEATVVYSVVRFHQLSTFNLKHLAVALLPKCPKRNWEVLKSHFANAWLMLLINVLSSFLPEYWNSPNYQKHLPDNIKSNETFAFASLVYSIVT